MKYNDFNSSSRTDTNKYTNTWWRLRGLFVTGKVNLEKKA
jgi:hypothetical protein